MKPDSPDPMLAPFFERQRAADGAAAPSFARLSSVAPARRPRRRPLLVTALAALAVPALAVSVLRLHLARPESSVPLLPPAFGMAVTWSSATDALLPDYSAEPLVSPPPLGGAWTDELLPPPRTTVNE